MSKVPVFRPSFGNRPDQLVGRQDMLEQLRSSLGESYPGSQDRAILIVGQRGMGKTALLLETTDMASELNYVVARVTCGDSMLDTIIELLQLNGLQYIEDPKRPIKGFSAGALGFSVGLTFTDEAQKNYGFRVKLEMLCKRLSEAGKRVLIVVDEVEPDSSAMRDLSHAYQELVGEGADIAIVMAGLPAAVSSLLTSKTLTFLNRATRIELGGVSIPEVAMYYSGAFKREKRVVDAGLIDKAAAATDGFPYLLQLIGYYLTRLSNEGEVVTEEQVDRACELAYQELDAKVLQAMLSPLSRKDIAFLKAMASDDDGSKVADIEDRLHVSQGTIQTYRRRLLDAGVITTDTRGEVNFVLPQLREYVKTFN